MAKTKGLSEISLYWLFGGVILVLLVGIVYLITKPTTSQNSMANLVLPSSSPVTNTRTPVTWSDYAPEGEIFTIKMPGEVQTMADTLTIGTKTYDTTVHYASHDEDNYVVRTGLFDIDTSSEIFGEFIAYMGTAQAVVPEEVSGDWATYQNLPAYNYVVRDLSTNLYHQGRVVIAGKNFLIIDVISPDTDIADFATFADSLTIKMEAFITELDPDEPITGEVIELTPEEAVALGLPNAATPEQVAAAQQQVTTTVEDGDSASAPAVSDTVVPADLTIAQ